MHTGGERRDISGPLRNISFEIDERQENDSVRKAIDYFLKD